MDREAKRETDPEGVITDHYEPPAPAILDGKVHVHVMCTMYYFSHVSAGSQEWDVMSSRLATPEGEPWPRPPRGGQGYMLVQAAEPNVGLFPPGRKPSVEDGYKHNRNKKGGRHARR